jgi:hypothetical protein
MSGTHMSRRTALNIAAVLVVMLLAAWIGWKLFREEGGPGTSGPTGRPPSTALNQIVEQARRRGRAAIQVSPWQTDSDHAHVELVGIAKFPDDGSGWWKPNGSKQDAPLPEVRTNINNLARQIPAGMRAYRLFVRAGARRNQLVIYPKAQAPARWLMTSAVRGDNLLDQVIVLVPESWRQLDFGVGVTIPGEGDPIFDVTIPALRVEHSHDFKAKGYMQVSPIMLSSVARGRSSEGSSTEVVVSYFAGPEGSLFESSSIWSYVKTTDGRQIWGGLVGGTDQYQGDFVARWTYDVRPEQIQSLSCRARPHEYAEYRGISLEMGRSTTVKLIPLAPANMNCQPSPAATSAPATATAAR